MICMKQKFTDTLDKKIVTQFFCVPRAHLKKKFASNTLVHTGLQSHPDYMKRLTIQLYM